VTAFCIHFENICCLLFVSLYAFSQQYFTHIGGSFLTIVPGELHQFEEIYINYNEWRIQNEEINILPVSPFKTVTFTQTKNKPKPNDIVELLICPKLVLRPFTYILYRKYNNKKLYIIKSSVLRVLASNYEDCLISYNVSKILKQ
jgi:hypothetical protein